MSALLMLIGCSVALLLIRVVAGPGLANRAVAVDALTTVVAGFLVLVAYNTGNVFLIDISLVYIIFSFAFVVIIARYMEGKL